MKKFELQIKTEWVLGACAIILFVLIGLFYIWGTDSILSGFGQAYNASPAPSSATQFQSDTAQKILKDRGIIQ